MASRSPRRLKALKNNLIYTVLRGLIAGVRRLPFLPSVRLGGRLGRWAYWFLPYERRMIRTHLRIAFGSALTDRECDRLGRDCLDNLGRGMMELIHAPTVRARMDDYVTCEGRELLDEALALGKGVIVVTAHTGNWEVMAMWAAARGYPTNAIAREVYDPRINELLCQVRRDGGVNPILRGQVSGARQMIRALRNNELLALVIDQDTKVPGVFVDFFGRRAHTPVGVAQLARKFGSPVICGFSSRKPDGTLHVTIGPAVPLVESDDADEQLRLTTQRYSDAIEAHIRQHPAQWVWMHRRWKTKPK